MPANATMEKLKADYAAQAKAHIAEIEQLRAKVAEQAAEIELLREGVEALNPETVLAEHASLLDKLTAEQAKVKVLVDALEQIVGNAEECTDADDWTVMVISMEAYHICDEALATVNGE